MILFSEREGFKPVKSDLQINSMNLDLKNSLWNAWIVCFWDNEYELMDSLSRFFKVLWMDFLKEPIDSNNHLYEYQRDLRGYFSRFIWYDVYDFVEFVANNYPDKIYRKKFMEFCNNVLEREFSGYRFVNGILARITSEEEIKEVEESIKEAPNLVSIHLGKALELLSDKKSPDYRNSIKESISAIESLCNLILGEEMTFGQALNKMERENKLELHGALKNAFSSIYGYTNTSEGIRHGLLEKPNLDFEDAKFMLVSCSAFTNYLMTKAAKSNIEL